MGRRWFRVGGLGAPLAGLAALTLAGAALAQDQTINEYVAELVAEHADLSSETLVGEIILDEIGAGESASYVFDLDPDTSYFLYSACDDDCYDIDLFGETAEGDWVDSDEEEDAEPLLMIIAGESGEALHVTLDMIECETDVCVFGLGLYAIDE